MARIRMAQYGTGHGHAGGKMNSMLKHPDVEVAGIFEPNAEKAAAARSGRGHTFRTAPAAGLAARHVALQRGPRWLSRAPNPSGEQDWKAATAANCRPLHSRCLQAPSALCSCQRLTFRLPAEDVGVALCSQHEHSFLAHLERFQLFRQSPTAGQHRTNHAQFGWR